jgi:hypothetical protein
LRLEPPELALCSSRGSHQTLRLLAEVSTLNDQRFASQLRHPSFAKGLLRLASKPVLLVAIAG